MIYYSVQNLLFFNLLSKNVKIKIYRAITFRGSETWSVTLR